MVAAVAAWESKKLSNEVPLNTAEEMSLLVCEFNRLRSENKDIQEKRNPPRWTAKLGQYSEEAFARVMTPRFLLALFAMVAALVFIGNRPIPSSVMFAFSSMHQVSQVFQFQSSAALGVISQETTQDDLTSLLAEKLFKTAMLPSECEYKDQPPSSIQDFHMLVQQGIPTVFRNAGDMFGEDIAKWRNPQYLIDSFGEAPFTASVFDVHRPDERFGRTPKADGAYIQAPFQREITLAELIRYNRTDRVAFIEQGAVFTFNDRHRPYVNDAMYSQWKAPHFVHHPVPEAVSLWMGRLPAEWATSGKAKESATHIDPVDNLFLQLSGTKRFRMFHANDVAAMHSRPMRELHSGDPDDPEAQDYWGEPEKKPNNFSPIEPKQWKPSNTGMTEPQRKMFPQFRYTHPPVECELGPGDALYIPAFTWHSVESYGTLSENALEHMLNIGVSAWFTGDLRYKHLFKAVLALLQDRSTL